MIPLFPLRTNVQARTHTHTHVNPHTNSGTAAACAGRLQSHLVISKVTKHGEGEKKTKMVLVLLLLVAAGKEGDGMTRNTTNLLSAQAGVMFNYS